MASALTSMHEVIYWQDKGNCGRQGRKTQSQCKSATDHSDMYTHSKTLGHKSKLARTGQGVRPNQTSIERQSAGLSWAPHNTVADTQDHCKDSAEKMILNFQGRAL